MATAKNERINDYMQGLHSDRNKDWTDASQLLENVEPYLLITVQGLGRLDIRLIKEDTRILSGQDFSNPLGDLTEHLTVSYLWVLGLYEVVRTLSQRMKADPTIFPLYREAMAKLKQDLERLRIPLAKMEPARRHKATDYHVAFQYLHAEKGASWRVSSNQFITRKDLSDGFLTSVADLRKNYVPA